MNDLILKEGGEMRTLYEQINNKLDDIDFGQLW